MGLDQNFYKKDENGTPIELAYWRKVNCLHGYFTDCALNIDEVIGDNCVELVIDRKDVIHLLNIAFDIVDLAHYNKLYGVDEKNPDWKEYAEENLPTTGGFFFGSYEYDEEYLYDIVRLSQTLSNILLNNKDEEFYYEAWY